MINVHVRLKAFSCKKYYSSNSSVCICEYSKYLTSIDDDSVIVWDEIINLTDYVLANMENNIPANVASTVPLNFHNKKVRY